jgi:hypothetical protein
LSFLESLNSLEEPLVGLLKNPDLSDEELRAFVQKTRALRESRQSFKAAVMLESKTETKEKIAKATALFNDF